MKSDPYLHLRQRLQSRIAPKRLITGALRTLAYGTDASFYRLIPKLVVQLESEEEVQLLLREAGVLGLPVTFRAAGTSLSGQAISDSVLAVVSQRWRGVAVLDGGAYVRLKPAVIGAHANTILSPYGRKIGPDPASINSAMIAGIAANNASGMCCGTAQNSYRTLHAMRLILPDGTLLDTGDPAARERFRDEHRPIVERLDALARRVRANGPLADRIRGKYLMKNTTGYSLNALVDFEDPIDILQHLMIGSEGTLGFIAEITLRTVPELPCKASTLMVFPDIATACEAVALLKRCPVDAVELMDRASLRSVEEKPGMPPFLRELSPAAASLLVETRAASPELLETQIADITEALGSLSTVGPIQFTDVPAQYTLLWNIRKGLFPSVGAMRDTGTTVIIEDVAFPVPRLAAATLDLQQLFRKHGYDHAIIFGHALEGNLHFVFHQDFNSAEEIERYRRFIADVTSMVVHRYEGALKAEHGTGRNMAPFVVLEWGAEAYALMREIKEIFDPNGLLNPGVILNEDKNAHVRNLKPLPAADPLIDKCIECGFCEVHCPSKALTLTPRQRIVAYREMQRLRATGQEAERLRAFAAAFQYDGDDTCATDGLCATSCPVGIDTGKLVKELRLRARAPAAASLAGILAENMGTVTRGMRVMLRLVDAVHAVIGTKAMTLLTRSARALSGNALPLWNPWMPRAADRIKPSAADRVTDGSVVYFPSCINRSMGPARYDENRDALVTRTVSLLNKAGYAVVFPEGLDGLCCGMAFASKGFKHEGDRKARELEEALLKVSRGGTLPVLVDMSPCLLRMKETFTSAVRLYEPVEFTRLFLAGRLEFHKKPETVSIHSTCSTRKMGLDAEIASLAAMCAERVVVPEDIECCGWAGDRGFTFPELNASALADLRAQIPQGCTHGYSTSRTCEIGLSLHSGISYRSILYLVDECTTAGKRGDGD